MHHKLYSAAFAAMAWALTLPASARAGVIHIPKDQPTIQAGIDAAADGDTVLVAPGIYTGPGNRDISLWGKTITLKSSDGPNATIIDAQGSRSSVHRGFFLNQGETHESIIDGFTITGGHVIGDTGGTGPAGGGGGGGIFIRESSPLIRNCIITRNVSATLGAVFVDDGRAGGVYVNGSSLVQRSLRIASSHITLRKRAVAAYSAPLAHLT